MVRRPIKKRRATPRRSSRVRDEAYMDLVRQMSCSASMLFEHSECQGAIEADHAGKKRGMGVKTDDETAIPLCHLAHMQRHAMSGPFKGWSKTRMREWLDDRIKHTQAWIRDRAEKKPPSEWIPF